MAPGAAVSGPHGLLDERGPETFRTRAGALLRAASRADFAVQRIRLGALDLTEEEVAGVRRCRVLLGHFDAGTLVDAAEGGAGGQADAERLRVLRSFLLSGRLEVRSAGMGGWSPDFSVFRGAPGSTALLGAHYFGDPYLFGGPSFTVEITDSGTIRRLSERFEELWRLGHDVLPAIRSVVESAHALALGAAGPGGSPDRPLPLR